LVWIPSTLASASFGVGHGALVFTSDLLAFQLHGCGLAASLRPLCCAKKYVVLPREGM
jgi:hypothetical protein